MGWLIFLGYVAVWLFYGWRLTVHLLDQELRSWADGAGHLEPKRLAISVAAHADDMRHMYVFAGFTLALFWPLVAPARGVYRIFGSDNPFRTPIERQIAERIELEELREFAREHRLPMPGSDQR